MSFIFIDPNKFLNALNKMRGNTPDEKQLINLVWDEDKLLLGVPNSTFLLAKFQVASRISRIMHFALSTRPNQLISIDTLHEADNGTFSPIRDLKEEVRKNGLTPLVGTYIQTLTKRELMIMSGCELSLRQAKQLIDDVAALRGKSRKT